MNVPAVKPPRSKPFAARLSPSAHALIHQRAREAGLSARQWLEAAILADRTQVIARHKPHPDLATLLFQINRAGNNLNQLAHHFNSLTLSRSLREADVQGAIATLVAIQDALNEALQRAD